MFQFSFQIQFKVNFTHLCYFHLLFKLQMKSTFNQMVQCHEQIHSPLDCVFVDNKYNKNVDSAFFHLKIVTYQQWIGHCPTRDCISTWVRKREMGWFLQFKKKINICPSNKMSLNSCKTLCDIFFVCLFYAWKNLRLRYIYKVTYKEMPVNGLCIYLLAYLYASMGEGWKCILWSVRHLQI